MVETHVIPEITVPEMLSRYDALLIDAYGVLVHRDGAFEGAAEFIQHLQAINKPYCILTNDASRNALTASQSYESKGVVIPPEFIITSGSLIGTYIHNNQLQGAPCLVMGTDDSRAFVEEAGGKVVEDLENDDIEAVIVCDDAGFPFLETVEATISLLFRRLDAGKPTHMVVANPDLLYQKNEREYGITGGSIALLIEHALQLRYMNNQHQFVRLGKPHAPIFEQATERLNTRNVLMIGDQVRTDIQGANRFGIDSALIATGLVQIDLNKLRSEWKPTYILPSLLTP